MEVTADFLPTSDCPSEVFIDQIMKSIHLDRTEATAMAVRMLLMQIFMVSDTPIRALGESQGAA